MSEKKDLTRIEDLAELLHDENEADPTLPDLPGEMAPPEELPETPVETEEVEEVETIDAPLEETSFASAEALPDFPEDNLQPAQELTETTILPESPDFLQEQNFSTEAETQAPDSEEVTVDFAPEEVQEPSTDYEPEEYETPAAPPAPTPAIFSDIKDFAENMSFGDMTAEGNPPFSLVLKNIRYEEDAARIIELLKEYKILKEENEDEFQKTISRGSVLIPRMSEFAAIYLAHRLRSLSCEVYLGLSEEIQPPKNYEDKESRGLVSKRSIFQNYHHELHFELDDIDLNSIRLSTMSQLEGFDIREHLGIITEHTTINAELLEKSPELNYEVMMESPEKNIDHKVLFADNTSEESLTLSDVYKNLTEKLKPHAVHLKGNAIVGINYQVSPLLQNRYKITCTGNVVLAVAKEL